MENTGTETPLAAALREAESAALAAINSAADIKELEAVRAEMLGKKSRLRELMKQLGTLPQDQRPAAGQAINAAQGRVDEVFLSRHTHMQNEELMRRLATESIAVTLPSSARVKPGAIHPLNQTLQEIERIFVSMGFNIATGPEVESEYNNFDALNIAANHPARDMHDTFYVPGGMILRTHTSPVQIRYMLAHKAPVAIIAPGRVYRVDDIDATHSPVFHQVEGLLVDKDVSFAHLKGTLQEFLRAMFGPGLATRFRPSFFPFTEPSAEVDVQCFVCHGKRNDCRVCKGTGWIEVAGAGMVHPQVLLNVGYDPEQVSGFAFGLGVERFTMLHYGLNNIRDLYENDVRFLGQFA
jgi:phenylalanyl-tRNA synthetase alpha chain